MNIGNLVLKTGGGGSPAMDWQFVQVREIKNTEKTRKPAGPQSLNAAFFFERKTIEHGPSRPIATPPFVNDIM